MDSVIPWLVGAVIFLIILQFVFVFFVIRRKKYEGQRLESLVQVRTSEIIKQQLFSKTLNEAAALLLEADTRDYLDSINRSMDLLCRSVGVDRVYLWQHQLIDGDLYFYNVFVSTLEDSDVNNRSLKFKFRDTLPSWLTSFYHGELVNGPVDIFSKKEKVFLETYNVKSVVAVPLFLNNELWGFASFDDYYTERVFTENEVNILRSWGFLAVGALQRAIIMKDLKTALDAAQSANRAKSAFLANMSHEIRTPLNAILGMTSIGKAFANFEKKDYSFSRIEEASQHLLGIINDILDMSKIEANKFELSFVNFKFEKMIQRVVNVVTFRSDEKHQNLIVNVDKAIPEFLSGDDQRIAQVITNIVGNAIKFTPDNGTVSLDARLMDEADGVCTLQIMVTDTGIGISTEQQDKLFNAFQQAESSMVRKFGGTGLGLSISRSIVEMMNGKIWIKSELGKGSTFAFTIQLKRGDLNNHVLLENFEDGQIDLTGMFAGRRLLLVEDVAINREIVQTLLEPTQLNIECAENGVQAVRMFSEEPQNFDIIMMDVQMPEMDGYEATSRIRAMKTPEARHVPIIALTANVFREDIEKCLIAGMNGHIGKPLDINEVIGKLRRYLS